MQFERRAQGAVALVGSLSGRTEPSMQAGEVQREEILCEQEGLKAGAQLAALLRAVDKRGHPLEQVRHERGSAVAAVIDEGQLLYEDAREPQVALVMRDQGAKDAQQLIDQAPFGHGLECGVNRSSGFLAENHDQ